MKVIIAGVTGRAGREALKSCLDNDRITKLVVLTRKGLSGEIESHPKVDLVLHQDFTQYSEYLIQRLQGAEACIWYVVQVPGCLVRKRNKNPLLCRLFTDEAIFSLFFQSFRGKLLTTLELGCSQGYWSAARR